MADQNKEAAASDPQPVAPEAAPNVVDPESLRTMLDTARSEADRQRETAEQYLNLLQRVQADFVNYKRRVEAERETQAEATQAETIRAFLPIVDDLQRALEHVPAQLSSQSWVEGFRLIERNLATALERLGVHRMGAEGDVFDPNLHEAVAYEEHPTQPEGHVATVIRPGYQLGERVVRPAQVSVARAAPDASHPEDERGRSDWPRHQPRRSHGNGGVDRTDFGRPRNIERA